MPITGRSQLVAIGRDQEMALGLQSYRQILGRERIVRSGEIVNAVQEIGRRLALAAAGDDPGFDWEFNVVDSTHPSHETRIRHFEQWMPKAPDIKQQYCSDRTPG